MQRLFCLEKRLEKDKNLPKAYQIEIKLLAKGYAVLVSENQSAQAEKLWYLSHFPVCNPNKGKVRLVFDATAKTHGYYLNDFLLTGPDLFYSLFEVLLKFRINKMAFAGDIKEMCNRVRISEKDTYTKNIVARYEEKCTN